MTKKTGKRVENKGFVFECQAIMCGNQQHVLPAFTLKIAYNYDYKCVVYLKIKFLMFQVMVATAIERSAISKSNYYNKYLSEQNKK